MSNILTLVSPGQTLNTLIDGCTSFLNDNHIKFEPLADVLSPEKAADLTLKSNLSSNVFKKLRSQIHLLGGDIFLTAGQDRRKKLLIADMDSTIVTAETLDEIAVLVGIGDQIKAITKRAMRGELDFHDALRERVALLKGQPADVLAKVLDDTNLSGGAASFVKTMAKEGAHCVLVSGGFTYFTEAIAKKTGFAGHHGNILDINENELAGTVGDPILDKESKKVYLNKYADELDLSLGQTLAIGDGANDLAMLEAAGLGIGYRPKPLLLEALDNVIMFCDLTAALYAQGYKESEFIVSA